MPDLVYEIINLLGSIIRLIGMALLGAGLGWLSLDLLRKIDAWQGKALIFLGLLGIVIAVAVFTAWGALGAFAIGIGVAIFVWGMPKKVKEEKKE